MHQDPYPFFQCGSLGILNLGGNQHLFDRQIHFRCPVMEEGWGERELDEFEKWDLSCQQILLKRKTVCTSDPMGYFHLVGAVYTLVSSKESWAHLLMFHCLGLSQFCAFRIKSLGLPFSCSARLIRALGLGREKSSVQKDQGCVISISPWHLFKLGDFGYFSEGNNLLSSPSNLFSDRSLNSLPFKVYQTDLQRLPGRMFTKDFECCQEKRERER